MGRETQEWMLTSLKDKETLGSRADRTTTGMEAAKAVGANRLAIAQDFKEFMLSKMPRLMLKRNGM